jgi:WD40 repeat protein
MPNTSVQTMINIRFSSTMLLQANKSKTEQLNSETSNGIQPRALLPGLLKESGLKILKVQTLTICDRSEHSHPDGYRMLASGDDFGQVKLYRYPSMVHPSKNVVLHGHSSHVTKVKFGPMIDGALSLFSVGGNDTTVI